jgi:hypothetical protein
MVAKPSPLAEDCRAVWGNMRHVMNSSGEGLPLHSRRLNLIAKLYRAWRTRRITYQAAELVLRAFVYAEPGAEAELPGFAARSPEHLKQLIASIALHYELEELSEKLYGKKDPVQT